MYLEGCFFVVIFPGIHSSFDRIPALEQFRGYKTNGSATAII